MSTRSLVFRSSLIILLIVLLVWASSSAQQAGESVSVTEPAVTDLYLAGQRVRIAASVAGDVVAAGREIVVQSDVAGDVIVAGERIEISGNVADDVRAAGRRLDFAGNIDGHLVAAGSEITLAEKVRVVDWAWLAGQRIDVRGDIEGDLRAAGGTVVISGNIGGQVEIMAEKVRVEPGAVIAGDFVWRGRTEPDISVDAEIRGQIIDKPIPRDTREDGSIFGALFFVLSMAVLAGLIGLLFPNFSVQLGSIARQSTLKAFGAAVITVLLAPPVIVLCFVTGVGFMVALVLLLIFLALLLTGLALGMLAVVHVAGERFGRPIGSRAMLLVGLLAAAVILWIIGLIPLLGGLVFLALWLLGVGALELELYGARNNIGSENK